MSKEDLIFHPIISSIQRIALYETKARFYLIGSNNTQTRFRVLKIDRTDPKELILVDDKVEYNKQEIHQLLNMIGFGNRGARGGKTAGFNKLVSAFGIVGFIRFLEGYYIILVTKRRKIAMIGAHSIYKIEDTATIYIPSDYSKPQHPDEQRYLKMFMAIDLSTNFYYSYSYDITHTLQMNMAPPRQLAPAQFPPPAPPTTAHLHEGENTCTCSEGGDDEDIFETWKQQILQRQGKEGSPRPRLEFGVRSEPHWRFVWNTHLLAGVHSRLHPDWILYTVHGFVEQGNLNIFGRPVYLTIIARRSNRYAGTRFLKRGANACGDVANEVETEQIVHDSMLTSFSAGRFSSFVQMRGSIPSFWSQDVSKMVPKPAIAINLSDPFAQIPARHINNLMHRYGSPVIFLNLVKKREKRKHESLLTDVIGNAVKYLNQFLPPEFAIEYYHFDMARKNKGTKANVLDKLSDIAQTVVRRTGMFLNCRGYDDVEGTPGHQGGRVQTGLVRVNCVDCLDRTNTAQFAIGKCVLAHQLYALGVISSPVLEFDSDCVRLLEGLYEDHGDTLALQYGGSQLVHRIKTYRKTAPWSSHGNDIMQTLSRYYSNTFSDAEKQNTMNLFLGYFVPRAGAPPVWDYPTDYSLHHPEASVYVPNHRSLTKWWDDSVLGVLPRAFAEMRRRCCEVVGVSRDRGALEMVDAYQDHNRPDTYTVLADTRELKMCHTLRDLAPQFTHNYSPFVVRGGAKRSLARAPPSDNCSDSDDSCSSDDSVSPPRPPPSPLARAVALLAAPRICERDGTSFLRVRTSERVSVPQPNRRDLIIYKRYVNFERKSNPRLQPPQPQPQPTPLAVSVAAPALTVTSALRIDSSADVIPPTVPRAATELYRRHVGLYAAGPQCVAAADRDLYRSYVGFCR